MRMQMTILERGERRMARIRQKLNSRSGASILLALVMLLVATMVSSVVISAAVTTANRVGDDREHQQQMLAVNSAARLAVETMKAARYTVTTSVTHVEVPDEYDEDDNLVSEGYSYTTDPITVYSPGASADPCISTMLLAPIHARAVESDLSVTDGPYYFTLVPGDGPDDGPEIAGAIVRFTLSKAIDDYKLKGAVYLVNAIPDSPGTGAQNYENAIGKSTARIGISARLRYTNDGGIESGPPDYLTVTTTEEWFFDTFELYTVGLEE